MSEQLNEKLNVNYSAAALETKVGLQATAVAFQAPHVHIPQDAPSPWSRPEIISKAMKDVTGASSQLDLGEKLHALTLDSEYGKIQMPQAACPPFLHDIANSRPPLNGTSLRPPLAMFRQSVRILAPISWAGVWQVAERR